MTIDQFMDRVARCKTKWMLAGPGRQMVRSASIARVFCPLQQVVYEETDTELPYLDAGKWLGLSDLDIALIVGAADNRPRSDYVSDVMHLAVRASLLVACQLAQAVPVQIEDRELALM